MCGASKEENLRQSRSEEMLWTNHNQNRGTIETTERFERLQELLVCIEYDCLSGPERQESLIEYLGKFSCTDNIPKLRKGDVEGSSGTESSSESESE